MAVLPLHAATDGLIRSVPNTLVTRSIFSRGLLWDFDIAPQPQPPTKPPVYGGGGGFGGKSAKSIKLEERIKNIKIREDEEILVIIKSFMQCQ